MPCIPGFGFATAFGAAGAAAAAAGVGAAAAGAAGVGAAAAAAGAAGAAAGAAADFGGSPGLLNAQGFKSQSSHMPSHVCLLSLSCLCDHM